MLGPLAKVSNSPRIFGVHRVKAHYDTRTIFAENIGRWPVQGSIESNTLPSRSAFMHPTWDIKYRLMLNPSPTYTRIRLNFRIRSPQSVLPTFYREYAYMTRGIGIALPSAIQGLRIVYQENSARRPTKKGSIRVLHVPIYACLQSWFLLPF